MGGMDPNRGLLAEGDLVDVGRLDARFEIELVVFAAR